MKSAICGKKVRPLPLDGGSLRARFFLDLRLNARPYLLGFLLVMTGWIAGGNAAARLDGEAADIYGAAATAALAAMEKTGGSILLPLLRSLWVNGVFCALIAAGGIGGAMPGLSALTLLASGVPQGCAAALLWRQGGEVCALICVIFPALALLFATLKYWTVAIAGAGASRAGEVLEGYGRRLLRCVPLLLFGVLMQGWFCPLLFRVLCWILGK